MKNTDKDCIFIQFICVNPVHLRLNSLNLCNYPGGHIHTFSFFLSSLFLSALRNQSTDMPIVSQHALTTLTPRTLTERRRTEKTGYVNRYEEHR